MRGRFGEHMVDGIAGENIIIEYDLEIWSEDLGKGIAIENQDTGHKAVLGFMSFAAPCREFSLFAAQSQHERLPAAELKDTLQFLGEGRRGFLLVMGDDQDTASIRRGDRVFVVDSD
jgi:hypothetical protein